MLFFLFGLFQVRDLLNNLPASGAFKHGPSYIYRLWRGLLDQWISTGADVYVVTPLLDAKRLSDVLLMLVKHKLSGTRVHLMCLNRCDADAKFPKVLKDAKDILRELKAPNKKRLVQEERLKSAEQRLDVRFGRFHCKLIAMCHNGRAEVMVTSASYHKWHFELENGDTLAHFKLTTGELVNNYLAPLGLAHQVLLDSPGERGESLLSAPSDRSLASTVNNSSSPTSPLGPASPHFQVAAIRRSPTSPAGGNRSFSAHVARSNSMSPSSPHAGPSSPHSRSVPSVAAHAINPVSSSSTTAATRLSSPSINHHSVNLNNSNQQISPQKSPAISSMNNSTTTKPPSPLRNHATKPPSPLRINTRSPSTVSDSTGAPSPIRINTASPSTVNSNSTGAPSPITPVESPSRSSSPPSRPPPSPPIENPEAESPTPDAPTTVELSSPSRHTEQFQSPRDHHELLQSLVGEENQ